MTQHTSRRCKGYFNKESDGVLHQMTWPPQSLDLKPIEMLSDEADPRVKEKQPTSAQHMWELLQDCWKSIPGVPEPHPPVQFQLAMSLTKAFQRTVSQGSWAGQGAEGPIKDEGVQNHHRHPGSAGGPVWGWDGAGDPKPPTQAGDWDCLQERRQPQQGSRHDTEAGSLQYSLKKEQNSLMKKCCKQLNGFGY
uniref:Uncharacterized protein n=1 Tax=Hucho hucho TaxID=62062 RepID=A0A4W5PM01_9TELE